MGNTKAIICAADGRAVGSCEITDVVRTRHHSGHIIVDGEFTVLDIESHFDLREQTFRLKSKWVEYDTCQVKTIRLASEHGLPRCEFRALEKSDPALDAVFDETAADVEAAPAATPFLDAIREIE